MMSIQRSLNPDRPSLAEPTVTQRILGFYDRHRWPMLGIVALFYLAALNGQWHPEPDSALYLSIGRNLAQGMGFSYHGQVNALAYPGWPWMLSLMFKWFGVQQLWPAHGFMLACALGVLGLFYVLVRSAYGRPTAVWLTCVAGMTQTIFRYAYEMRNDMPFFLGVMTCLVGCEYLSRESDQEHKARPWRGLVLLIVGLAWAMVMRPAMFALLGALGVTGLVAGVQVSIKLMRKGSLGAFPWDRLFRLLVTAVAGVLVVVAIYRLDPRRDQNQVMDVYEQDIVGGITTRFSELMHHVGTENLPRLFNSEIAVAAFGTRLGWWGMNVLGGLAVVLAGVGLLRQRLLWGTLFVLTLAMVALVPRPEGRYLLAVMPLLVLGWWRMCLGIERYLHGRGGQIVVAILIGLWVVPNVVRVGWITVQQRQVPFLTHYRDGRFAALPELAQVMQQDIPADDSVIAPQRMGRILSYMSGRKVVDIQEAGSIDVSVRPLWIVSDAPAGHDELLDMLLGERHLKLEPAVVQVPQLHKRPPLVLRKAVAIQP